MKYLLASFFCVGIISVYAQVPTITSVDPSILSSEESFVITGTGFNTTLSNNKVAIGGQYCVVTSASTTSLTVTAPKSIATGKLVYTNIVTDRSCTAPKPIISQFNIASTQNLFNTNFTLTSEYPADATKAYNNMLDFMDVNNDGKVDIVNQGSSSTQRFLNVVTNNSISSSTPVSSSFSVSTNNPPLWAGSSSGGVSSILMGDFDSDGDIDIHLFSNQYTGARTLTNNSSNQFSSTTNNAKSWGSSLSDYNLDGKVDLTGSYGTYEIYFIKNSSSTAIALSADLLSTPTTDEWIACGAYDMDNDGDDDYLTLCRSASSTIHLFKNSGNFTTGTISPTFSAENLSSGNGQSVAFADFNDDGLLDFAVANGTSVDVFSNTTSGSSITFSKTNLTIAGNSAVGIAVSDINNDELPDLIVSGAGGIHIHENSSTSGVSSFSAGVQVASNSLSSRFLTLIDLNLDGAPEFLTRETKTVINTIDPTVRTYASGLWSNGTGPSQFDDAILDDDLTLTAGEKLNCNNLTINPGKTLTLSASVSGYSQLKVNGAITNNGTITQSQYVTSTGHHGISSPMTAGFTTTTGNSLKLYGYDATSGAWDMSPSTTAVGAGFFAPVQASNGFQSAAGTFSVTGTPNTSHTYSLGYAANTASGGSGNGWNLIGNPYTCSLNWPSLKKTKVNNAYYVWDASNGNYQYYSTSALSGTYLAASSTLSGLIPPMQAFWVQTTASGGSIVSTMAFNGSMSWNPTFYKTTPDNLILYAEDLSDQSLSDAMWITHAFGYTNDFEGDQDAWKRSNYGGQANIYSYHNGEKMAINAIDLSSTASIPVGVKAPSAGKKYKLVLEQIVNNQEYQVVLEDKLYNSFTDITNEGYVFTYGAWQNEEPRFVLHISQSTVGIGEETLQSVKLYQQGDRLIIQGNAQEHGHYSLVTLDGRQVAEGLLQAGMANIEAPMAGVYILQLTGVSPVAQRVLVY